MFTLKSPAPHLQDTQRAVRWRLIGKMAMNYESDGVLCPVFLSVMERVLRSEESVAAIDPLALTPR